MKLKSAYEGSLSHNAVIGSISSVFFAFFSWSCNSQKEIDSPRDLSYLSSEQGSRDLEKSLKIGVAPQILSVEDSGHGLSGEGVVPYGQGRYQEHQREFFPDLKQIDLNLGESQVLYAALKTHAKSFTKYLDPSSDSDSSTIELDGPDRNNDLGYQGNHDVRDENQEVFVHVPHIVCERKVGPRAIPTCALLGEGLSPQMIYGTHAAEIYSVLLRHGGLVPWGGADLIVVHGQHVACFPADAERGGADAGRNDKNANGFCRSYRSLN